MRLIILFATIVAFTIFSATVVAEGGYFGFLAIAWAEPWGMQIFLDLVISLFLFTCWLLPDAKSRGIAGWPYVVAILALGSIGALGYLIHRELNRRRGAPESAPG